MNTRGLMELIALNIGYDLGILSQRIFAMLVVMALVTTFMTGPLLTLFAERVPASESCGGWRATHGQLAQFFSPRSISLAIVACPNQFPAALFRLSNKPDSFPRSRICRALLPLPHLHASQRFPKLENLTLLSDLRAVDGRSLNTRHSPLCPIP